MIIKANHQLDLLKNRREVVKYKRLTYSQLVKIKKRSYFLGIIISSIGIAICGWTSYHTIRRIQYKEKLVINSNEYQQLKTKYNSIITKLRSVYKINNQIAQGIIGTKSGSALFLEVREKLPKTIQLISLKTNENDINLQGRALQPLALGSINSLQLQLSNSFLIENKSSFLKRAWESKNREVNHLNFILNSKFSTPNADKLLANYERLGSFGLYRRVNLLKQEGLIK